VPLINVPDRVIYRDGWKLDYRVDHMGGKLVRKLTQPDRDIILTRNAQLRKRKGAMKDSGFARMHLSIPLEDYEMLKKKYPILVNGSNHERSKWYKKFIRSIESIPYRVQ
jgi:hypothetical protein